MAATPEVLSSIAAMTPAPGPAAAVDKSSSTAWSSLTLVPNSSSSSPEVRGETLFEIASPGRKEEQWRQHLLPLLGWKNHEGTTEASLLEAKVIPSPKK